MSNRVDNFYKNQSVIYKYFIYFISVALIVYFFPKGGKFKYEFQKGKIWQYENLEAPFSFSIQKTDKELAQERLALERNRTPYYVVNDSVYAQVIEKFKRT